MITETKVFTRMLIEIPWLDPKRFGIGHCPDGYNHPLKGTKYNLTQSESADGLTLTKFTTYDDFATWSNVQTARDLRFDANFVGQFHVETISTTYTGLDTPFILTRTYTFTSADSSPERTMLEDISQLYTRLTALTSTDTVVTVVEEFENGSDYKSNYLIDFHMADDLLNVGCARTYLYAAKT